MKCCECVKKCCECVKEIAGLYGKVFEINHRNGHGSFSGDAHKRALEAVEKFQKGCAKKGK